MTERLRLLAVALLCFAAALVAAVWFLMSIIGSPRRAWRIAVGFDQLGNATFGGDEDETISARCWRYRGDPHYSVLVQIINAIFWDKNHCEKAFESEQLKRKNLSKGVHDD